MTKKEVNSGVSRPLAKTWLSHLKATGRMAFSTTLCIPTGHPTWRRYIPRSDDPALGLGTLYFLVVHLLSQKSPAAISPDLLIGNHPQHNLSSFSCIHIAKPERPLFLTNMFSGDRYQVTNRF